MSDEAKPKEPPFLFIMGSGVSDDELSELATPYLEANPETIVKTVHVAPVTNKKLKKAKRHV